MKQSNEEDCLGINCLEGFVGSPGLYPIDLASLVSVQRIARFANTGPVGHCMMLESHHAQHRGTSSSRPAHIRHSQSQELSASGTLVESHLERAFCLRSVVSLALPLHCHMLPNGPGLRIWRFLTPLTWQLCPAFSTNTQTTNGSGHFTGGS